MALQVRSDALTRLIDPAASRRCSGAGYEFTEGPVWSAARATACTSATSPATRAGAGRGGGHGARRPADVQGQRHGATTSTATCSCASRCRAASSAPARRRARPRRLPLRGEYLNSPNDVVARGSDGSIYFTDPDYGRWNDWIGCDAARPSASRASTASRPAAASRARGRGGRVRPAQRPVLLARREAAVRQRLAARATIKVFDVAADGALVNGRMLARRASGIGVDGRGQRRRHGVRRARQRLDNGPRRRLDPRRPPASARPRSRRARSAAASCWGGARPAHAVPDDDHDLQSVPTLVRSARVPGNH